MLDSKFTIDFLIKEYNIDLSDHLTPNEKSIARSFLKMCEESTRWVGIVHRFRYGKAKDVGMSPVVFKIIGDKMLKESNSQGYGKHSQEELYQIGRADLTAIDNFIGDKKFLMGDQPCNEDAGVFACLCQIIYNEQGALNKFIKGYF